MGFPKVEGTGNFTPPCSPLYFIRAVARCRVYIRIYDNYLGSILFGSTLHSYVSCNIACVASVSVGLSACWPRRIAHINLLPRVLVPHCAGIESLRSEYEYEYDFCISNQSLNLVLVLQSKAFYCRFPDRWSRGRKTLSTRCRAYRKSFLLLAARTMLTLQVSRRQGGRGNGSSFANEPCRMCL